MSIDRQRVGGFEPQPAAGAHARQPLLRLQHGQGAVQPLEVVDVGSARAKRRLSCRRCCRSACATLPSRPGLSSAGAAAGSRASRRGAASARRPVAATRLLGGLGRFGSLRLLLGGLARSAAPSSRRLPSPSRPAAASSAAMLAAGRRIDAAHARGLRSRSRRRSATAARSARARRGRASCVHSETSLASLMPAIDGLGASVSRVLAALAKAAS